MLFAFLVNMVGQKVSIPRYQLQVIPNIMSQDLIQEVEVVALLF
jgi:hypothetical protein